MLQKSLLFKFREKISQEFDDPAKIHYNLIKGIWENSNGNPIIAGMIKKNLSTIKTATREGIDQSETSSIGNTIVTKTREGVDQSEVSLLCNTLITATRENTDQSEKSCKDEIQNHATSGESIKKISNLSTSLTDTRESVDRLERSI